MIRTLIWVPRQSNANETPGKRAFRRAAELTFGVFGSNSGDDGHKFLEGGSGVLTHPFSGLTAKHVGRYLMSLDTRGDRPPRRAFETQHAATVFQHVNPLEKDEPPHHSLLHVTRAWDSPLTDISLVQVAGGEATTYEPSSHFRWRLLPPPIGAKVYLIGFPKFSLHDFPEDDEFGIKMELNFEPAEVTAIYPIRRGTGLLNYPCFEVNRSVPEGFSGGAAIYDDSLCGIVSVSSTFEAKSWCAALWPLAFLEYDSEIASVMTKFSELFRSGVIQAVDWRDVEPRISEKVDEQGRRYAHIADAD